MLSPETSTLALVPLLKNNYKIPTISCLKRRVLKRIRGLCVHYFYLYNIAEVSICSLFLLTFEKCVLSLHWKCNLFAKLFAFLLSAAKCVSLSLDRIFLSEP